ncbi:MAG TPA: hypothetical protein VG269_16475 [Tepidisphaeraceae bacterium]|nr:hypothetical protein [Tepidisphaeraceae bacterium]
MRNKPAVLPFAFLAALIVAIAFLDSPRLAAAETSASSAAIESLHDWMAKPRESRPELKDQAFAAAALSKDQAEKARQMLWDDHLADLRATREKEWKDEAITIGSHTLRFKQRQFGDKPKEGWSLYISMHGGGNAPAEVNDQQWENQIHLYTPKEGIYIAPRAPTNTWNLWHEGHIDDLYDRLLEDAFAVADVNPNRVYIMGYSAGGDGVYQLAPRMADRWAAAAMMAGHPNDASPLGLRNIGFAIHVGALDNGYNRNKVAGEWKQKLDDLHTADPKGYVHVVELHPGRGHWMEREDAVAVDWMAGFTRNPIPEKVVWKQAGTTHERFYWLAVPPKEAKGGSLAIVSREGQKIEIEKAEGVTHLVVMLNDAMLDLDKPVTITMKGRELFKGVVPRTIGSLQATIAGRGDPFLTFSGAATVTLEEKAR